jgi:serine/threonine-protein kinase
MARVFRARDEALGREIVVKVLDPALAAGMGAERFAREVRLAASLQEPHIVPLLSAGTADGGLSYYTMPDVAGRSLRERIREARPPMDDAVGILRDVARALAYANGRGVVHRDIKPENILPTEVLREP